MLGKVSKPGTLAPVTRQQSLGSHGETQRTVNHAWGGGRGGILDDQDWSPWPSPPPPPPQEVTSQPVLQTSAGLSWFPW